MRIGGWIIVRYAVPVQHRSCGQLLELLQSSLGAVAAFSDGIERKEKRKTASN